MILVEHYSGLDHPLMKDHDDLGWVVFLITLKPLIIIDRRLLKKITKKNDIARLVDKLPELTTNLTKISKSGSISCQ